MLKKFLINGMILSSLIGPLQALSNIGDFVNTHCANVCTGESTQCWNCYTAGVDLWQDSFDSPNDSKPDDSDDSDPYGNVGFKFDWA